MDVDDLPPADRLWWPFAVLVALATVRGDDGWSFDARHQQLTRNVPDGGWLRMQRLYGGRAVLWASSSGPGTETGPSPRSSWTGIPGWATSDAVHDWLHYHGATFVAWHSRHGWDTATPSVSPDAALAPLLDADLPEALIDAAAAGTVDATMLAQLVDGDPTDALDLLRSARHEAAPVQGAVRTFLANEIRAQMLHTRDRDRLLHQRPAQLVRWARIANVPAGFHHAVHQQGNGLDAAPGNTPLAAQFLLTLTNVLESLHREEATDQGGAWLFARVGYDGLNLGFDRRFDGRPYWYVGAGPTLDTLADEMARRHPAWRPAWAALLPQPGPGAG